MKIYGEIKIHAPKERVWRTLTDFDRFNQWNKLITDIKGDIRVGGQLSFKIHPIPGLGLPITNCEILVMDAKKGELRWEGPAIPVVREIIRGNHYFIVKEIGPQESLFIHGENFDGFITPALQPLLEERIWELYEGFNQALKTECEKS